MVNFTRVLSAGTVSMVIGCLTIAAGCSSSSPTAGGGKGGAGANTSGSVGGTGGSNGTNSNAFVTTVSGSLTLDAISTSQAQQLCRDAYAYIHSQITPQQSWAIACSDPGESQLYQRRAGG